MEAACDGAEAGAMPEVDVHRVQTDRTGLRASPAAMSQRILPSAESASTSTASLQHSAGIGRVKAEPALEIPLPKSRSLRQAMAGDKLPPEVTHDDPLGDMLLRVPPHGKGEGQQHFWVSPSPWAAASHGVAGGPCHGALSPAPELQRDLWGFATGVPVKPVLGTPKTSTFDDVFCNCLVATHQSIEQRIRFRWIRRDIEFATDSMRDAFMTGEFNLDAAKRFAALVRHTVLTNPKSSTLEEYERRRAISALVSCNKVIADLASRRSPQPHPNGEGISFLDFRIARRNKRERVTTNWGYLGVLPLWRAANRLAANGHKVMAVVPLLGAAGICLSGCPLFLGSPVGIAGTFGIFLGCAKRAAYNA